jgi:3-hydroxyisobutyrate dehydrogenase
MASNLRIGFAGIGNMGWPMAKNLVAAGHEVHVYDTDGARAARFATECAGQAADSPQALGAAADVLFTMLPTGLDVAALVLGPSGSDGAVVGLRRGAIVVDMSSSDPLGTRELGGKLRERGITLIDAPVSGLVPRAAAGTLTIMIGSDDEDSVATVTPLFQRLGERLIRVGSLGCGHAMKALNNAVSATAFIATAEALIVGTRFGLDPRVMTQVLSVSTGKSFHSEMTFPDHVLTRRFASGFTVGLLVKDVGIAGGLSAALGMHTPLIDLAQQLWTEGRDEVGAGADNTAAMQRWERLNDIVVESPAPTSSGKNDN